MTVSEFDRGYWYTVELKQFAQTIGVPAASRLRKDELEAAIKRFLESGEISTPPKRSLSRGGVKDVDRGLSRGLPVSVYTNDRQTKEFIEREARRVASFRKRSGAMYRLNRWREEQLASGRKITYGDVADEYVRLCRPDEAFARVPHGRFINFMSDFLAGEKDATREQAIIAWRELKGMDLPKEYSAWAAAKRSKTPLP